MRIIIITLILAISLSIFLSIWTADSVGYLSLEDMKEIRGGYRKCVRKIWADPGCETRDCWQEGYYSYKRYADYYYKCDDTEEPYTCEMIGGYYQDCAYGAQYWSAYCIPDTKVAEVFWQYPYQCVQYQTSS